MGGVYFNIQIIGDDQQQFANGGDAFQDMEEGAAQPLHGIYVKGYYNKAFREAPRWKDG